MVFAEIEDYTIAAPHFDDQNEMMKLDVSASWVKQNAIHLRRQSLMDFWTCVKGCAPPVNNIGYHEDGRKVVLKGMLASHAVYRGLERPIDGSDNGEEVYVFISSPSTFYRYVPHMVCVAKSCPSPKNAVFACYVRRYKQETSAGSSGMILSWEWVKNDENAPTVPYEAEVRYKVQVWRL
ncbi:hypothetical protein [Roseovarius sp. 217]|uniref:hypothetical protein n=1 Tax=Roseovarius sp. (strain 217) TaxID=314264 RepID=UPI0012ED2DE4|nr:hypothetical protein [Roseovarius sp. 217]